MNEELFAGPVGGGLIDAHGSLRVVVEPEADAHVDKLEELCLTIRTAFGSVNLTTSSSLCFEKNGDAEQRTRMA